MSNAWRRRGSVLVAWILAASTGLVGTAFAGGPPIEPKHSPYPPSPEATRFFERLVDRYRALIHYADTFLLEQVVGSADGDDRATTRTRVSARSRVDGDRLEVSTDADLLWKAIAGGGDSAATGDDPPTGSDGNAEAARRTLRRERDLALAPHLRLRFLDEPLREFQPGGTEAFRATGIAPVRHEDRDMVRIELRSGGESPGGESSVIGITVDPGSMLIRKVDGEEQWSDGRSRTTTISIDPEDSQVAPQVDPQLDPEIDPRSGPLAMPAAADENIPTTPASPPQAPDPPTATMGLG